MVDKYSEPGKVTIVRTNCNDRDDFINIQLRGDGGTLVVDVEIELVDFSLALTGLGDTKCKYVKWSKHCTANGRTGLKTILVGADIDSYAGVHPVELVVIKKDVRYSARRKLMNKIAEMFPSTVIKEEAGYNTRG